MHASIPCVQWKREGCRYPERPAGLPPTSADLPGADCALGPSMAGPTRPPQGLLTIAAMFSPVCELPVADMTVSTLRGADLERTASCSRPR